MKALITAATGALLVVPTLPTSSPVAISMSGRPPQISWADGKHRYGWVSTAPPQRRRYCARDGNVLCATDDGGNHWRAIFRGGNEIFGYLRWSKNAGVVSAGAHGHGEVWTRDGGRHWWGTGAIGPGAFEDASGFGAGPRFSLARVGGRRQLRYAYAARWPYRVLGWFPTRPLRCAGEWSRWGEDVVRGPNNICFAGPVGGDGMSAGPAGPAARLTVTVNTEIGEALMRSNPVAIDCGMFTPYNGPPHRGAACVGAFGRGSTVNLRMVVSSSDAEVQWTGCSRYTPPGWRWAFALCEVVLAEDTQVTASVRRPQPPAP